MPNFAGILTTQMDHHVLDKTGYDADTKFNIHLEFSPDEHMPGADKRNPRTEFAPADAPNIFCGARAAARVEARGDQGPAGRARDRSRRAAAAGWTDHRPRAREGSRTMNASF